VDYFLLSYLQILQLISFSFLMSMGQILFKKTSLSLSNSSQPEEVYGLLEGFFRALLNP